jgi:ABC-type nitrate/sulfonate/bicarbonate transport system permease component
VVPYDRAAVFQKAAKTIFIVGFVLGAVVGFIVGLIVG